VPSKDGSSYTVDHSSTLYVYDRHNRLRLIAQPDFAMDALVADLRRLVAKE
jgi:cytochrome oxidase Cu insertion factor (SCO1/SenC/PrrC family)